MLQIVWWSVVFCAPSHAYLMTQNAKYRYMFDHADTIVIATPIESIVSLKQLPSRPILNPVRVNEIETIDTRFEVALILKGGLKLQSFHLLHLNRKDRRHQHDLAHWGDLGTFFIDFDKKENKERSYIIFMNKIDDNYYVPAWSARGYLEGSRSIIPVPIDGSL